MKKQFATLAVIRKVILGAIFGMGLVALGATGAQAEEMGDSSDTSSNSYSYGPELYYSKELTHLLPSLPRTVGSIRSMTLS